MPVTRSKVEGNERVDEPLMAEEIRVGLARSPQIAGEVFVGVTFVGVEKDGDGETPQRGRGDVVLTVELAQHLAGLLDEACAKVGRERDKLAGN